MQILPLENAFLLPDVFSHVFLSFYILDTSLFLGTECSQFPCHFFALAQHWNLVIFLFSGLWYLEINI